MYHPKFEEVAQLAKQRKVIGELEEWGDKPGLIPVYQEIGADLETPVSAYMKIARAPYSFLLESVEGGERQARYSFLGTEPYQVLKTGLGTELGCVDPLALVEKELSRYQYVALPGLPRFLGGAIGYVAYETVRYTEPRIPVPEANPIGLPEAVLMFTDTVLVFDHVRNVIKIVSHVRTDEDLEVAYQRATERIDELARRLSKPIQGFSKEVLRYDSAEGRANFNQEYYEEVVTRCKEYIVDGDIIQVVPSRRLARPTFASPFNIYRSLRSLNPSPYMYFLELGDFHIIGASPEALVRVEGGIAYNFPLAGTYRRGATAQEDQELAHSLRHDEKEVAEHIMLVDLGRNDIGRIAEPGTVKVSDLMRVVKYSHVMHLESEIQGRLRRGYTMYDALRSCLPAGTLSGAPKIRAMEIIAEMEQERRGPYGGAVGYFGFQGNMDVAIPIRTIVYKEGVAYIQAGGGIVFDSDPATEYQETINKMAAPLRAIDQAERGGY